MTGCPEAGCLSGLSTLYKGVDKTGQRAPLSGRTKSDKTGQPDKLWRRGRWGAQLAPGLPPRDDAPSAASPMPENFVQISDNGGTAGPFPDHRDALTALQAAIREHLGTGRPYCASCGRGDCAARPTIGAVSRVLDPEHLRNPLSERG